MMMKIGIMVHSYTGNTLMTAEKLRDKLVSDGHDAVVESVTSFVENPSPTDVIELDKNPDTSGYEALVIAGPVRGFAVSPVVKEYILRIPSLEGKKVNCFVTEFFPFAWMGGKRAVDQMRRLCEQKGAQVVKTSVINWTNPGRIKMIENAVKEQSGF
jgi:NAD(P)H dehydrogenase (quinone)